MSLQEGLDLDTRPGGARAAVEAVVMVADEPVPALVLAAALALPLERVEQLLRGLAEGYDADGRGFELRESASGWRVYSRAEFADVVERFVRDGATARLSRAALETLAIIAYRQPVARATVSSIRGVSADATIRTLLQRGLVAESEDGSPNGAILYVTTGEFCERLGLTSVDQLPPLAPYLPEADVLDDIAGASR